MGIASLGQSGFNHPSLLRFRLRVLLSTYHPALLFYDYALTFHLEVSTIWSSKISGVTFAYLTCRYGMASFLILNAIPFLVNISNLSVRAYSLVHLHSHPTSTLTVVSEKSNDDVPIFIKQTRCTALGNTSWALLIISYMGFISALSVIISSKVLNVDFYDRYLRSSDVCDLQ